MCNLGFVFERPQSIVKAPKGRNRERNSGFYSRKLIYKLIHKFINNVKKDHKISKKSLHKRPYGLGIIKPFILKLYKNNINSTQCHDR